MTSHIYAKWKEAVMTGLADSDLDNSGTTGVYAALIDTASYTWSDTHQFYSDLAGIGGTPMELTTGKSYTGGLFASTGVITFAAVAGTVSYEALVLYRRNTGANTTWRLVAYIDAANVTGLPVTSDGGDITVTWDAAGIFQL